MIKSIPGRFLKLGLAACCGTGAVTIAVLSVIYPEAQLKYAAYGAAAASVVLLAQVVGPTAKKEQ